MISGKVITSTIIAILLSLLSQLEFDNDILISSRTVALSATRPRVFQYVSDMTKYEQWFPGIVKFEPDDTQQMGIGKHFQEVVAVPFFGEWIYDNIIIGYESPRLVSFICDNLLEYRVDISVERRESTVAPSSLNWKLYTRRRDYLTYLFIRPFLKLIYSNKSRQAMFNLRDIFYKGF